MGSKLLMFPQNYELWAQIIDGRANMNYGLQILTVLQTYELWAPNIDGPANL